MKYLTSGILLLLVIPGLAQSGRVTPGSAKSADAVVASSAGVDLTVKEMFNEANGYIRAKAGEFDAKKVPFTDRLFNQTKLEQRQLAAKYATISGAKKDLAGEDFYYLGMLHWISENLDGTAENLRKFIAIDDAAIERRQSARAIVVVVSAKQRKLDEAESLLAEYLKTEPKKLTERSRMAGELAKAYQAKKEFGKMTPHAEQAYAAAKALLSDATSRARGLDEILDAGMLMFEAFRDSGEVKKADDALEDMRTTAASVESPSFYYYAVDQKIKHMIATGRKPAALDYYMLALNTSGKDFPSKTAANDVFTRLRKRDKHYKLLGETPPPFTMIDQWFPGKPKSFESYKGKVVLLDFWATWCGPCFEAFPHLIEWYQDFKSEGFEILGVTRYYEAVNNVPMDNPREIEYLKRFREKERLPYDFVVGKDQSIQHLYGATALPTAVLIDRKGIVRYIEAGTSPTRIAEMREMLIKLLAEK